MNKLNRWNGPIPRRRSAGGRPDGQSDPALLNGDMELNSGAAAYRSGTPIAIQTCGLFSGFTQLDDVIHEGILVLLSAVDKYDPEKESPEAYIAKRLREW